MMYRRVRVLLLGLVLAVFLDGFVRAACPEGDVHEDCRIDWQDVQFLADRWLDAAGSEGDIFGGAGVNFADFAKVVEHWGDGLETGSLFVEISPVANPRITMVDD